MHLIKYLNEISESLEKPSDCFNNDDKVNFMLFNKGNAEGEDLGELTSLSEMEISNVHDASLIQLEKDLFDTQAKL